MTHIALIGAGLMGTGLARLFVRAGYDVTVFDASHDALVMLRNAVPDAAVVESLADAVGAADMVIEAVSERLELKQAIFAQLVQMTRPDALLGTNSSVIPVGSITALLDDADAARCVGTHFWNPPDIIPLVEVIEGPRTALATIHKAMAILAHAGKEPVHVRRDVVPGNRMQHALWREAIALIEEGVCDAEGVDHIVKRSFGLRLPVLGPLENADLVGLELTEQIHRVVYPTLSSVTTPSSALTDRIERGTTGVGSGAGFYERWTPEEIAALRARLVAHLDRMLG